MMILSVGLLVIQHTAQTLIMRYSVHGTSGTGYSTSTAVVLCEVGKLLLSIGMLVLSFGFSTTLSKVYHDVLNKDLCVYLIPGLLYTVQNNLLFVASSNLEPAVFQVLYQMKLVTTALVSVSLLKKQLRIRHWAAGVMSVGGLAIVQLSEPNKPTHEGADSLVGFVAVLAACACSGIAGCYLERTLKMRQEKGSFWIQNMQLALCGTILGLGCVVAKDWSTVRSRGFLFGYNSLVWLVIFIQSVGGILISSVVKFGDALLKSFATSVAIVLTALISWYWLGFAVSIEYCCGSVLVVAAAFMYSWQPSAQGVQMDKQKII